MSGLEKSVLHLFDHLAYGGVMDPQMRGDLLHGVPVINTRPIDLFIALILIVHLRKLHLKSRSGGKALRFRNLFERCRFF